MRTALLSCIALLATVHAVAKPVGDPGRGEVLTQRWCATCHQPVRGTAADMVPTFAQIAGKAKQDPAYIRAFLNRPHAPMPPLNLNQAEIADIMAYFDDLPER